MPGRGSSASAIVAVHGRRVVLFVAWACVLAATTVLAVKGVPMRFLQRLGLGGLAAISFVTGTFIEFAVPGVVATAAYALVYPAWIVGVVAGVATGAGALVKFELGKASSAELAPSAKEKLARLRETRLVRMLLLRPSWALVLLATVPNPLFDPFLILLGSTGVPWRSCVLPLLVGKGIRCLLIAFGTRWVHG
jgi:membrane protein YqaA with SNARE-associated domain